MQKQNLKILIADLERAIAEIKAEVYSDAAAYRIDSDKTAYAANYLDVNDDDGEL
tara:strand:- start:224 stop:388 length:165 start_codon:yes stop_codon:yes gene_type:complete